MTKEQFITYVHGFYGPLSTLYPMGATKEQVSEALEILIKRGEDVAFDSFDREKIRDIMIDKFGLVFPETRTPQILKPSVVLRLIKGGKLPRSLKGGKVHCARCGKAEGGDTEAPDFWENGSYTFCPHCDKKTIAMPKFPACENFPDGITIDLTGERKVYPLVMEA